MVLFMSVREDVFNPVFDRTLERRPGKFAGPIKASFLAVLYSLYRLQLGSLFEKHKSFFMALLMTYESICQ